MEQLPEQTLHNLIGKQLAVLQHRSNGSRFRKLLL
jgi:hypothetical protein